MKVLIDTDILSMFAKIEALDLLGDLLGQEHMAMTPAIREEISVPLQYGYDFPQAALSQIPILPLSEQAWREYERLWSAAPTLGKGELEAVAYCKAEGALFVTNDTVARRFALNHNVRVISLQTLLRGLWLHKIQTKAEVRELLERIKRVDYLEVPPEVEMEIFGEGPQSE